MINQDWISRAKVNGSDTVHSGREQMDQPKKGLSLLYLNFS